GDHLAVVRAEQVAELDVRERHRHLVVDHAHHLLGRDAVGGQRRDQRAGAGSDVDIELIHGAVDRQQIERPQRTDLVDAAGESAAAEHQRRLGLALAARAGLDLDDVAHLSTQSKRDFRTSGGFRTLERRMKRVFLLVTFALLALAPSAHATSLAATQRLLAREMGKAGSAAGAYVVDVGTGQELYSYNADVERLPASVEKLYTSSAALMRYGTAPP